MWRIKKLMLRGLWVLARSSLLLVISFSVYYFFWLLPDQRLVNSLTELEQHISRHYLALLGHRLALFEFARLDENSGDYGREKEGILSQLETFSRENNQLLADELQFQTSRLTAFSAAGRLENEMLVQLKKARDGHRDVIRDQQALLQKIRALEAAAGRLSSFLPEYYFNQYRLPEEKDSLASQLTAARQGILDIKVAIERLPGKTDSINNFVRLADSTTFRLDELAGRLREGGAEESETLETARRDAIVLLDTMRSQMHNAEVSLLTDPSSLDLLTRETNIVLAYRHILDHIDHHQARLFTQYASAANE